MPTIENVIDDLLEEYDKAKRYNYIIRNPIAYALYQVWKKYDHQEVKYLRNKKKDYF